MTLDIVRIVALVLVSMNLMLLGVTTIIQKKARTMYGYADFVGICWCMVFAMVGVFLITL